jgi:hypothetical protein
MVLADWQMFEFAEDRSRPRSTPLFARAREAPLRIFQSNSSHQSMNLIAQRQQVFRQLASVLCGDAGY